MVGWHHWLIGHEFEKALGDRGAWWATVQGVTKSRTQLSNFTHLMNKTAIRLLNKSSLVTQTVNSLPAVWEIWVQPLGREDPLEKETATHSSIVAWRIPWTEEPGKLQTMVSQRVGHDCSNFACSTWPGDSDVSSRFRSRVFDVPIIVARNR